MEMKSVTVASTRVAVAPDDQYLNRELSLLEFNMRVLAQAEDVTLPLLERLRFLCIVSSNVDEFFEVRVASLLAQHKIDTEHGDLSGLFATTLEHVSAEARRLITRQYALYNDEILPQLAGNGIHLLRRSDRNPAQKAWVKRYFDEQVRPLLTPVGLDPAHPFPRVINKSLNFIVELAGKDAFGRGSGIAIMKVPRVLPRVIRLPDELSTDKGESYCLLSSVIQSHMSDLFTGREVLSYSQFRVTRNSDLWVDEDEVKNLRQALQSGLHSRHYGFAVRLEVAHAAVRAHLSDFLLEQFSHRALAACSRWMAPSTWAACSKSSTSNVAPGTQVHAVRWQGFPTKLLPHHDIFAVLATSRTCCCTTRTSRSSR